MIGTIGIRDTATGLNGTPTGELLLKGCGGESLSPNPFKRQFPVGVPFKSRRFVPYPTCTNRPRSRVASVVAIYATRRDRPGRPPTPFPNHSRLVAHGIIDAHGTIRESAPSAESVHPFDACRSARN